MTQEPDEVGYEAMLAKVEAGFSLHGLGFTKTAAWTFRVGGYVVAQNEHGFWGVWPDVEADDVRATCLFSDDADSLCAALVRAAGLNHEDMLHDDIGE